MFESINQFKKICKQCLKEKHLQLFALQPSNKGGHSLVCKECNQENRRQKLGIITNKKKNSRNSTFR